MALLTSAQRNIEKSRGPIHGPTFEASFAVDLNDRFWPHCDGHPGGDLASAMGAEAAAQLFRVITSVRDSKRTVVPMASLGHDLLLVA